MAVAEQQLSPEEKLLKVIQGGGEAAKEPSPEEKLFSTAKPPGIRNQESEGRDQMTETPTRVQAAPRVPPPPLKEPMPVPRPPKIEPAAMRRPSAFAGPTADKEVRRQGAEAAVSPMPVVPPPAPVVPQKPAEKPAPPPPVVKPSPPAQKPVEKPAVPATQRPSAFAEPTADKEVRRQGAEASVPPKPVVSPPAPVVPQKPAEKPAPPPPVVKPSPPAQKPVEKPAAPKKPAVEAKPPVPAKIEEPKKAAAAKPPPATDEKARLKVLKSDPAPQEKEAPAKPLLGAPGPVGIGGPADISSAGRSGGKFNMGAVNRGLAAAVLLILAFTAYEIWAAVKEAEVGGQRSEVRGQRSESGGQSGAETGSSAELPTLANYVDPWKAKDIFYQTTVKTGGEQSPKLGAPKPELAGRLKVIGFSKQPNKDPRVILRDTKDDKMFIVGTGEKIPIGDQPLELVQIQNDHVVLSDGNESISISVK